MSPEPDDPSLDAKKILIGRDEERKRIVSAISDAREGTGSMILIKGEAGIGKTRLIEECSSEAELLGFDVFTGHCFDYRSSPHLPFIEMLRDHFDVKKNEDIEESQSKVRSIIKGPVLNNSRFFEEFLDLFVTMSEPTGGFRIGPDNTVKLFDYLKDNGYKVLKIRGEEDNTEDHLNHEEIVIGTEMKNSIPPSRLERIATMVKGSFVRYKHCAIVNMSMEILSKSNSPEKLSNLIRIINGMAAENGGMAIHVDEGEPVGSLSKLKNLKDVIKNNECESEDNCGQLERKLTSNDIFSTFFKESSKTKPIIMVLEDLQWADVQSLYLLQLIARDINKERICILGSYRPEESNLDISESEKAPLRDALQRISRERLFQTITLDRLELEDIGEIIWELMGDKGSLLTPESLSDICSITEGNPGHLVKYLRELSEKGTLEKPTGDLNDFRDDNPIMRRLASLKDCTRDMVEYASTIGLIIDLDLLSRSLNKGEEELLDMLDELLETKMVIELEEGFIFDQNRIRDQIYSSIPEERKVEIHKKIAEVIESGSNDKDPSSSKDFARHLKKGGNCKRAAGIFFESAGQELERSNEKEAIELLNEGLDCLTHLPPGDETDLTRIKGLLMKGNIEESLGDSKAALMSFNETVKIAEKRGETHQLSSAYRRIGDIMLKLFEWEQTVDYYLKSLHLSKKENDQEEISMAFRGLGTIYYLKGEYNRSMDCYVKYMEFQKNRSIKVNVLSLIEIGDIYFEMGDLNQALAYYKLAIKKGEEQEITKESSMAYVKRANILLKLGEVEEAIKYGTWGYNMVKENPQSEISQKVLLSFIELMLEIGDMTIVEEAKEMLDSIEEKGHGDRLLKGYRSRVMGLYNAKKRDFDESFGEMEKALEIHKNLKVPFQQGLTNLHYGLVYFQEMKVEEALEKLKDASEIFKSINAIYYLNRTSTKIREMSFIREGLK